MGERKEKGKACGLSSYFGVPRKAGKKGRYSPWLQKKRDGGEKEKERESSFLLFLSRGKEKFGRKEGGKENWNSAKLDQARIGGGEVGGERSRCQTAAGKRRGTGERLTEAVFVC